MQKYDVVIVGSGPGGAASALYLLKAGLKPLLLEKAQFPRYHIGESLNNECGNCLRDLGLEAEMQKAGWPVKYGVTFYGTPEQNTFWVPMQKRDQRTAPVETTWQVRRSDFDQMLRETALARGAALVSGEALAPIMDGDVVKGVRYRSNTGGIAELHSDVLIDASGQATFLASKSNLTSGKENLGADRQIAIFSQIRNVQRDSGPAAGNTLIFLLQKNHWAWLIPLDDEVTSVGVIVAADYFKASSCSKEAFLQHELRAFNVDLSRRLPDLNFIEPVRTIANYSYQVRQFTGKGFLCVGDAHRFLDPIFSFGVYFAIKEAEFAAQAIQQVLGSAGKIDQNPFAAYQALVEQGQDIAQELLNFLWIQPLTFLIFAHFQYREEISDLLAGRLYAPDIDQQPVLQAVRKRMKEHSQSPILFGAA